jgi:hypothetical protein
VPAKFLHSFLFGRPFDSGQILDRLHIRTKAFLSGRHFANFPVL